MLAEKDDAKVVEEIYLVGAEPPADREGARRGRRRRCAPPATDHAQMVAEYKPKVAAFEAYEKTLDAKQTAWEDGLRNQKPTDVDDARRAHGRLEAGPARRRQARRDADHQQGRLGPRQRQDCSQLDLYTVVGLAETRPADHRASGSKCWPTRACRRRGRAAPTTATSC